MSPINAVQSWLAQHARAAISALGQFRYRLSASLMTTAVIGIALALPAGFLLLVDNLENATAGWDGAPQASLFVARTLPAADQQSLLDQVERQASVTRAELISADQALEEFEQYSGMQQSLALLNENPLPSVVVAHLTDDLGRIEADQLVSRLANLPGVEEVRLDQAWLQRLQALMQLANRGSGLIALLLGLTVMLVVGNTIRLDIENRRSEIEISKLIGGTNAFVRRPFLYTGLWYGLAGGILSALLLVIAVGLLAGPASDLAALYGSQYQPAGPGLSGTLTLIATGVALGLLGAWLAVGRHLAAIEPQ